MTILKRVCIMRRIVIVEALSTLLTTGTAVAQPIPLSQHGSIVQHVGPAVIQISYNRPSARGRVLFGEGGTVSWDRIWQPGANMATRIETSVAIIIEGHNLPRGEYSLWVIPRADRRWTLIINRAVHVYHTPYPGEAYEILRIDVSVETGEHRETLTWEFPSVDRSEAILMLRWGNYAVPFRIRVPGET